MKSIQAHMVAGLALLLSATLSAASPNLEAQLETAERAQTIGELEDELHEHERRFPASMVAGTDCIDAAMWGASQTPM